MDNFHSLSSVVDESDPMLTGDLLNKYSNVSDFCIAKYSTTVSQLYTLYSRIN